MKSVRALHGGGRVADWSDVTLVVIAHNEERNIGDCLMSAPPPCKRVVVDSGSTDRTVAICEQLGARVVHNPWSGYSRQYNFAFDQVSTPWTLLLDADERLSRELAAEMGVLLEHPSVDAWDVPRANYFCGQWMRHGGWYPDYQTRLFRTGSGRYELRAVHSRLFVSGARGRCRSNIEHYSYDSVADWVRKINGYTTLEVDNKRLDFEDVRAEWHDYDLKMKAKYALRRVPGRPLMRFVWMYLIRQGFRDGRRGLALALLSAFYEYLSQVKYEERLYWEKTAQVHQADAG